MPRAGCTDFCGFVPGANTGHGSTKSWLWLTQYTPTASAGHMRFDHRINDKQEFQALHYFTDQAGFEPFKNTFPGWAGASPMGFRRRRA